MNPAAGDDGTRDRGQRGGVEERRSVNRPRTTPAAYEIVVRGVLRERFPDAFRGWSTRSGDGVSTISGVVEDQAQLVGVIVWLGDCGLDIISVTPTPPAP